MQFLENYIICMMNKSCQTVSPEKKGAKGNKYTTESTGNRDDRDYMVSAIRTTKIYVTARKQNQKLYISAESFLD